MSRVLVTGGAGAIGMAVVRRLLGDPTYEVRVADQRPAPQWMRESCEVRACDLRSPEEARRATEGCTHVIHLAATNTATGPYTLGEAEDALCHTAIRAALEVEVERFLYVSCTEVFERAELFPTPESHLRDCPTPVSAGGFAKLSGEVCCRAAHAEHGLPYTICRAAEAYGPGGAEAADPGTRLVNDLIAEVISDRRPLRTIGSTERTCAPTHVEDVATGLIAALGSTAGLNQDFNIASAAELSMEEVARIAWLACGEDPEAFELKSLSEPEQLGGRSWPAVEKARELLGWEARIPLPKGIEATVTWLREEAR